MSPTADASDGKPANQAPPFDGETADSTGQDEVQTRILNEIALHLVAELDMETLVQRVTDVATEVTGARIGAFFYTSTENGEELLLYTLSGVPREAFQKFGVPRNAAIFAPTFHGEGVVRLDDVQADPRYGQNAPHHGMPEGHLPVRSYLAVPVVSRGGNVLGGLFLGHPEIARFDRRAEQAAVAVAAYAAIAIDNARPFEQANREIRERTSVQATLSEAKARFHAVAMNAPAAVYIKGRAGRYVVANRVASEALGRQEGAAGFTDHDLRLRFVPVPAPSTEELKGLVQRIAARIGRSLERAGLITRDIENAYRAFDPGEEAPIHALLGASITYRIATGPREGQVFTLRTLPAEPEAPRREVAESSGFSLHAGIAATASQRDKLEQLARYVARPPVATERLALTEGGQVRCALKTPYCVST